MGQDASSHVGVAAVRLRPRDQDVRAVSRSDLAERKLYGRRPGCEGAAHGLPLIVSRDVAAPTAKPYVRVSLFHVHVVENATPDAGSISGNPHLDRDIISLVASSNTPLRGSPCMAWYFTMAVEVASSNTRGSSDASAQVAEARQKILHFLEAVRRVSQADRRERGQRLCFWMNLPGHVFSPLVITSH